MEAAAGRESLPYFWDVSTVRLTSTGFAGITNMIVRIPVWPNNGSGIYNSLNLPTVWTSGSKISFHEKKNSI